MRPLLMVFSFRVIRSTAARRVDVATSSSTNVVAVGPIETEGYA